MAPKADPNNTPVQRRIDIFLFAILLAILPLFLNSSAQAGSNSWDGGGLHGAWSNAVNWNGDTTVPGNTSGFSSADTATFAVNVNSNVAVDAYRNVKFLTFDAGAGAFTFSGGQLALTNAGAITINVGVGMTQTFNTSILLSSTNNSAASFLNNSTTVGANLVIGSVTGQQGNNKTTTLTLGGSNTGSNSVGPISDGSGEGKLAVVKSGNGTWILSGTNTYTGATQVSGGTLLVNGSTASGSTVTVNNGGTLGGIGIVGGTVNVVSGGTINAGPSGTAGTAASVGKLTTGALTLTSGSIFHFDASGTSTTTWDQVAAHGATLSGSTLQLTIAAGMNFIAGTQYRLIDNTSLNAISGTFTGIVQGGTYNLSGYNFVVSYTGGTGNDFVLTAVPEPGTWAAAALSLLFVGFTQRRRIQVRFRPMPR